jgi:hypothetical protein
LGSLKVLPNVSFWHFNEALLNISEICSKCFFVSQFVPFPTITGYIYDNEIPASKVIFAVKIPNQFVFAIGFVGTVGSSQPVPIEAQGCSDSGYGIPTVLYSPPGFCAQANCSKITTIVR